MRAVSIVGGGGGGGEGGGGGGGGGGKFWHPTAIEAFLKADG